MGTEPEIFIIESLNLDEEQDLREGEVLWRMLKMIGKSKTRYYYIRTEKELDEVLDLFDESNYRYLHFSCHANKNGMATTFDDISYDELGKKLEPCLKGRRVFVSGCQMASPRLAKALFRNNSGCLSLLGPAKMINFDDAAAFWISFYHLMFKQNVSKMKHRHVEYFATEISRLLEESFHYYRAAPELSAGYRRINTRNDFV